MKTKIACLTCALAALFFSASAAHAAVIVSLEQSGANVVATATGAVNLTGLSPAPGGWGPPGVIPSLGVLTEGARRAISTAASRDRQVLEAAVAASPRPHPAIR